MDDIATAAVEAALAAGASYADARVMEIRTEAMAARNGVVETLDREERAGVGVRALIGSSWGFFAVPDVGSRRRPAGRRAGRGRRPRVRPASPGRTSGSPRRRPSTGSLGERVPRGPVVASASPRRATSSRA